MSIAKRILLFWSFRHWPDLMTEKGERQWINLAFLRVFCFMCVRLYSNNVIKMNRVLQSFSDSCIRNDWLICCTDYRLFIFNEQTFCDRFAYCTISMPYRNTKPRMRSVRPAWWRVVCHLLISFRSLYAPDAFHCVELFDWRPHSDASAIKPNNYYLLHQSER